MKRLVALIVLFVMMLPGIALADHRDNHNPQETCPDSDGWVKVDGLDGFSYTFEPAIPDGQEIDTVESCYKAGQIVEYGNSLTVTRESDPELSHASFRVTFRDIPTPPTSSTTTTVPEATTTTTESSTTTSEPEDTTTTIVEEEETTTTVVAEEDTPSESETVSETEDDLVLPFTGVESWMLPLAYALSIAGLVSLGLARRYQLDEEEE
jgi:hypothetical protein